MDSGFCRNEVKGVVMAREMVETVRGPVAAGELGFTLIA